MEFETYIWILVGVIPLVKMEADLSRIPANQFKQALGADQKLHYQINIEFQVTFYSAYTKYELVYGGVNYGQVAAEYV